MKYRLSRRTLASFALAMLLVGPAAGLEPTITMWYGDQQRFGHLGGHPQRWINLLGSIEGADAVESLQYRLNDRPPRELTFREDGKRLARDGDFNVEIACTEMIGGRNLIRIEARTTDGRQFTKTVDVHYEPLLSTPRGANWPLPYSIDWNEVDDVQDAVQVVDGHWKLTPKGIRTVARYYDRVLAFGDATWRDYEVSTSVTVHAITAPGAGANDTGVTHAAIALRWPGHDADGEQPSVKWHPLGATGEFRLGGDMRNCRWRIFDGQRQYYVESERRRALQFETPYALKHQVQTLADGTSIYRAKCWPAGEQEPASWDIERPEPKDDVPAGSALLIAHFSDVTFGNVRVRPIPPQASKQLKDEAAADLSP